MLEENLRTINRHKIGYKMPIMLFQNIILEVAQGANNYLARDSQNQKSNFALEGMGKTGGNPLQSGPFREKPVTRVYLKYLQCYNMRKHPVGKNIAWVKCKLVPLLEHVKKFR
jgi:hypothetical protein